MTAGVAPAAVAVDEWLRLNGVEQWVSIRGSDARRPVLLFLHGGPGTPETVFLREFNRSLEEDFLVVCWEQRGAGKSYTPGIPPATMTMDQFIADTHALTRHLRQRFGQQRLYLVGHSWGALLGLRTAIRHPDCYHALVVISQPAHAAREAELTCQWLRARAERAGHRKAVRHVDAVASLLDGPLPLAALSRLLRWVDYYGGGAFFGRRGFQRLCWLVVRSRVYTWREKLRYLPGERFSLDHLYDEISSLDLFAEISEVPLPVHFVHGRHDYQVPMAVAHDFYRHLSAPRKTFTVLVEAAHGALYEQPDDFHRLMRRIVAGGVADGRCPGPDPEEGALS